jgi:hypothetical protein
MNKEFRPFMQNVRNLQDEINKAGMGSPIKKLKLENAALVAERDALQKQLDEEIPNIDKFHKERDIANRRLELAMNQLRIAEGLIAKGVQLMSFEELAQWEGVRAWQETWEDEVKNG